MQKSAGYILLIIGLILIAFLVGFFVGRNYGYSPILTSKVPASDNNSTPASTPVEKVNINTADLEQLQTLPGIGQTIAKRILQHRAEHGPFEKVEDLTLVEGIGLDKLAQIIDYVTV